MPRLKRTSRVWWSAQSDSNFHSVFFLLSLPRPPPMPSPPALPWLAADVQRGPFAGRFRRGSQVLQSPAPETLQSSRECPQAHGTGLQHQGNALGRGSHALTVPGVFWCFTFKMWKMCCESRPPAFRLILTGVRSSTAIGNSFPGVSPWGTNTFNQRV